MPSVLSAQHHLSQFTDGRDNNFNLIRLVAAFLVLFSHSYSVVLGTDDSYRPLLDATGFSLGAHAVNIFFVISGLLVMQSWDRTPSPTAFIAARVLRIYPAILVYTILIVFFLGAALSDLPLASYFSAQQTWTYLVSVGSLVETDQTLPGLFADTPDASTVNASLWTIRYELICYMSLMLAGMLGFFRSPTRFTIASLAAACALLLFSQTAMANDTQAPYGSIVRFGLCFGIGVCAYHYRTSLRLHWTGIAAAGILAYLSHGMPLGTFALYLGLAYTVLWIAYIPAGPIRKFNKVGDYSYGVYIYAYPIQQAVIASAPNLSPIHVFLIAGSATLAIAILSWHFVEKPALKARSALGRYFSRRSKWRSREDSNLEPAA